MKRNIRVFLVDDHEVAREGLRRMLELEQDIEIVGEASGAEEALGKLGSISPDVILMDIKMPTINGLEATRLIKSRGVSAAIIVVSLHAEYLAQALEAGVAGYLVKDLKRQELIDAIRRVTQGELAFGGSVLDSRDATESALSYLRNAASGKPSHPVGASQNGSFSSEDHAATSGRNGLGAIDSLSYHHRPGEGSIDTEVSGEATWLPTSAEFSQALLGIDDRSGAPDFDFSGGGVVTDGPVEGVPESGDNVPQAQPVTVKEWFDNDTTRYQWDVELVVEPPVDAAILLKFCGWLRTELKAEIEELAGSRDGDSIFKVRLRKRVPLEDILWQFPDIADVREDLSQEQPESRRFLKRRKKEQPAETIPAKRLRLVL